MRTLIIDRIAGALGAEVSGIDLTRQLTEGEVDAAIEAVKGGLAADVGGRLRT